jgi:myo-inositol 2-dehydrogenase/D-chiro-inositol 1-dehydrogenase
MLKVTLVGAGAHSEHVHGPSLARYADEHPGEIALVAVCDLREERAKLFRERFGFARTYTDLDEMLEVEQPQACWVVAPIDQTRKLAGRVMERGVPVLFEKPPGQNLREAKELAAISALTGTPNQVAFNRRYAPCTQQAVQWAKEHGPFEYLYARMLRTTRMDETFAFGTGIHLLDCVRFLGENTVGPVVAAQTGRTESAAGRYNFHVHLQFGSGAWGRCDILPTCGMLDESYTLFGNTASIVSVLPWTGARGSEAEGRAELWVKGELLDSARWPAEPTYLTSGFYHEAAAFLEAVRDGRHPSPSAEESVQSVALAEAVQEGREVEF